MAKRLLDCAASDFSQMTKAELLFSIAASEGRVLASETIGTVTPLLGDVTNAELAAALGAAAGLTAAVAASWQPSSSACTTSPRA